MSHVTYTVCVFFNVCPQLLHVNESCEIHAQATCNTYATHCNTLRHTTTQYNTLQHTATHCNTLRVSSPDPRPEGRGPRRFFHFSGRELTFFRNSLQGEGESGRMRRSVAKGWGPGTRERQHASRDTIPERWGERTHPRTQAQLSLNCSALAAARLQLPTLASGVGKTNFTLDISAAATSLEATGCVCRGRKRLQRRSDRSWP